MAETYLFRWDFTIGSGYTAKTRTKRIQFGDGYEQEQPDGLIGPGREWKILCEHLEIHDALELEDYLIHHMRTGVRMSVLHPDSGKLLILSPTRYTWRGHSGPLRSIEIEAREVQEWP
jgi:phage-related protein